MNGASINRLVCLGRHWTWTDDARSRFERELASGWEYDRDPLADRLFGAYYQWCALLCGFSEALLDEGLLSPTQLDRLGADLRASLPLLQASRRVLSVIPPSREDHPRLADLLSDDVTLGRLRRVHRAFGDLLRDEQARRDIDFLDVHER